MHEKSLKTAKEWLSSPYDKITQEKVKSLIEKGGEALIESFYKELDFGTGGMRGITGVGPNRINKYTIGKATQGLANTLNSESPTRSETSINSMPMRRSGRSLPKRCIASA